MVLDRIPRPLSLEPLSRIMQICILIPTNPKNITIRLKMHRAIWNLGDFIILVYRESIFRVWPS